MKTFVNYVHSPQPQKSFIYSDLDSFSICKKITLNQVDKESKSEKKGLGGRAGGGGGKVMGSWGGGLSG